MYRTCNGCKALNTNQKGYLSCALRYKTKVIHSGGFDISCKPLEECPKPKTIKKFVELASSK